MVWLGGWEFNRRQRLKMWASFILFIVFVIGMLLSHYLPSLVLIMIRHDYKRYHSPKRLGLGPYFDGYCFNFCNWYQHRRSLCHWITDKTISTKVKSRRFGTQQSIYGVHGDLDWICSSHRFIRHSIPSSDLFFSQSRIIYLHGMFDPYKCTCA